MEFNIEKFIKFENDNDLFDRRIKDLKYWSLIRVIIYFIIESKYIKNRTDYKSNSHGRSILFFLKRMFIGLFLAFKTPLFIKRKDLLVFQCAQRNLIDGKNSCRYTYSIVDNFGSYLNLVSDSSYFNGCINDDKYSMDFLNLISFVYYKLFYKFNCKDIAFIDETNVLVKLINKCFDIELSILEISKVLISSYCLHKFYKKYFIFLLKKVKPKCIIYQEYYNIVKMTLNEVAKLESIETIELQHGVIGRGHIAYNFGKKYNNDVLPEKLFFWGRHWKETSSFPIDDRNKIIVGFPYHDAQVRRFLQNNFNYGIKKILIISDGDFSNEVLDIVEKLLYKLNYDGLSYYLVYKLHPKEFNLSMDRFSNLLKYKNVEVINDLKTDLYFLLANYDYIVGKYSTVLYEATSYNGKLLILYDKDYLNYSKPIVENGYATYFRDVEGLYNQIAYLQNDSHNNTDFDSNIFFKENSYENIYKYIKNIISE